MTKGRYFKYEGPWSDADKLLLCLDTGSWRIERPIVDKDKCIRCGICAIYCPTQCIYYKHEYFIPDLGYCKGCGICAVECPCKAIKMNPEEQCV